MNNIQSTVTYIKQLLKIGTVIPTSHPFIQRRKLRKSPLKQPHETMQSIQERSFEDVEKEREQPTWFLIMREHLQNYGNIKSP